MNFVILELLRCYWMLLPEKKKREKKHQKCKIINRRKKTTPNITNIPPSNSKLLTNFNWEYGGCNLIPFYAETQKYAVTREKQYWTSKFIIFFYPAYRVTTQNTKETATPAKERRYWYCCWALKKTLKSLNKWVLGTESL